MVSQQIVSQLQVCVFFMDTEHFVTSYLKTFYLVCEIDTSCMVTLKCHYIQEMQLL